MQFEYKELTHNGKTWQLWILKYKEFRCVAARSRFNNIPIESAWGGVFASETSAINTAFPYPEKFNTTPIIITGFIPIGTNAWTQVISSGSADSVTNAPNVQLLRGTANTSVSGYMEIVAFGNV